MLIIGRTDRTIDESGKRTLEYVCFIIGDSQSINVNASKIPPKFTHMTNMPEKQKLPLLRSTEAEDIEEIVKEWYKEDLEFIHNLESRGDIAEDSAKDL